MEMSSLQKNSETKKTCFIEFLACSHLKTTRIVEKVLQGFTSMSICETYNGTE